jgi:integrase/recombinase XerD
MAVLRTQTALVAIEPNGPSAMIASSMPAQANSDDHLIELWLHPRAPRTCIAYLADIAAFRALMTKPLRELTLSDLYSFQDTIGHLAGASQARKISAVKSLLSKGHKLGYLPINLGAGWELPKIKNVLAERVLTEGQVRDLIAAERNPRNEALLRVLYYGGLRISEACGLRIRDLQSNGDVGQVTVYGKGGKTRVVGLKESTWRSLALLRGSDPATPLFRSRQRRHTGPAADASFMNPSQAHNIVKAAARRAGLPAAVSAHWLRHAHVSHALDNKAPIHLVQATVGHASLTTTSRYAHARPSESSSTYLSG